MGFDLATLSADDFEPMVGSDFRVCWEGLDEKLTLSAIRRSNRGMPGKRHAFALVFKGRSTDILLQQRIHPLELAAGGMLELFLVPTGQNDDGTYQYEATFN